jgi:hypothetical protein
MPPEHSRPRTAWIVGALIVYLGLNAAGFAFRLSDKALVGEVFFMLGLTELVLFYFGNRRGWFR